MVTVVTQLSRWLRTRLGSGCPLGTEEWGVKFRGKEPETTDEAPSRLQHAAREVKSSLKSHIKKEETPNQHARFSI